MALPLKIEIEEHQIPLASRFQIRKPIINSKSPNIKYLIFSTIICFLNFKYSVTKKPNTNSPKDILPADPSNTKIAERYTNSREKLNTKVDNLLCKFPKYFRFRIKRNVINENIPNRSNI